MGVKALAAAASFWLLGPPAAPARPNVGADRLQSPATAAPRLQPRLPQEIPRLEEGAGVHAADVPPAAESALSQPDAAAVDPPGIPAGSAFDGSRPEGSDTAEFLALHAAVRAGTAGALPQAAREVRYLLVGGVFSSEEKDILRSNQARLEALGLDVQRLSINTEGGRKSGQRLIEQAVLASPTPVVLIGHSRGGLMIHDMYRRAPAVKQKVARLLLVQTPLAGTPFADAAIRTTWQRLYTYWAGYLKYGVNVFRTAAESTVGLRRRMLARMPAWDDGDLEKVYVLRTKIGAQPRDRFYERRRQLIAHEGYPENDGTVPLTSARVEGSHDVVLAGVNHNNLVLARTSWWDKRWRWRGYRPHPDFDPGDVTEALVRLMFQSESF